MKKLLIALLLLSSGAYAQSVKQSGTVTPTQVPYWVGNGIIGDGVTAFDSPVTTLGVTGNTTSDFCVSSQRATAAGRQQLCLGTTDASGGFITLQNYGTDSPGTLKFIVNGVTIQAGLPAATINGSLTYYSTTSNSWVTLAGNNSGTQCLTETASGVPSWGTCGGGGGSTPGGSTNSVQYNNSGTLGGLPVNVTNALLVSNVSIGGIPGWQNSGTLATAGSLSSATAPVWNSSGTLQQASIATLAAGTGINITGTSTVTVALSTPVSVANGGTGSSTAGGAQTNLGLGTMATQNANAVNITGATALTGLPSPSNASDAATKQYVDNTAVGLVVHPSVVLATTAALPANTYNNGSSGVGATLTANSNGNLVIDGTTNPSATTRILVKNEATAANNGIYTVTTTGGASQAYVLTRATDANTPGTGSPTAIGFGTYTLVTTGTANAGTGWSVTSTVSTIGTSAINWAQFSQSSSGTVSSVSVTTANGVSGSVTNPTTTPAISLTLGAITPTTVAIGGGSAITSSGAGGALGSNAFTSTAYLPLTGGTLSGTLTGADSGTWSSSGINNSTIGQSTPKAGSFTTLTASGSTTLTGTLTAGSLATPSSNIAGSICATAGGSILYNAAGNCYGGTGIISGIANTLTTGATNVTSLTSANVGFINAFQIFNTGSPTNTGTQAQLDASLTSGSCTGCGNVLAVTGTALGPVASLTSGTGITQGFNITAGAGALTLTSVAAGISLTPASGQQTTINGSITAPTLTTVGTVSGSLCQNSSGVILYEAGSNCYAPASLYTTCNVKNSTYGAKGDGTTDDTAAIQAAMTACGLIYMPSGTYKVTGPGAVCGSAALTLPSQNGIGIVGDGMENTVIESFCTTGDVIDYPSGNYGYEAKDFSVTRSSLATSGNGILFAGNATTVDPTPYAGRIRNVLSTYSNIGVYFGSCGWCVADNVFAQFNRSHGMYFSGAPLQYELSNMISQLNGGWGFYVNGTGGSCTTSVGQYNGLSTFANNLGGMTIFCIASLRLANSFFGSDGFAYGTPNGTIPACANTPNYVSCPPQSAGTTAGLFQNSGNGTWVITNTFVELEGGTGFEFTGGTTPVSCLNCVANGEYLSGLLWNDNDQLTVHGGSFTNNGQGGTGSGNYFGILGLKGNMSIFGVKAIGNPGSGSQIVAQTTAVTNFVALGNQTGAGGITNGAAASYVPSGANY